MTNTPIFDFYSLKILKQTSKNEFFDQLFQTSGHDTQSKKCCTTHELSIEWLIDRRNKYFWCQIIDIRKCYFLKKLSALSIFFTYRKHVKFFYFLHKYVPQSSNKKYIPLLQSVLRVLKRLFKIMWAKKANSFDFLL